MSVEEGGGGRGGIMSQIQRDQFQSWIPQDIKKRVCSKFVEDSSNGGWCQCGMISDKHGLLALKRSTSQPISHWNSSQHSSEHPTDAFGRLEFKGTERRSHFLRMSCDTLPSEAYSIMTGHWRLPDPNLVVSVVGGEGRAKMKPWVREVLRQGLVKASQNTGAWIMTRGLHEGVGRCVGEAVREYATAASSKTLHKVALLGIAPWGLVPNRDELVNPQGSFPAKYHVQDPSEDSCYLQNDYQAFLLVDDGSVGRRGGETSFRAQLEDYISHQRTSIVGRGSMDIPVLCMLVSGAATMLERLDNSLKKSIPWLVLAGSGGAADFVSDILESLSEAGPYDDLRERLAERVRKQFPRETETDKLVEKALSMYGNRHLITIYHGEQEGLDDFTTVLLKALVGASKLRVSSDSTPYTEALKLVVTWNRVDIAKSELFNGDRQWKYEDLETPMTDALVDNKPRLVRLFAENGFDINSYLTYGRLEKLYSSVAKGTLAYTLLHDGDQHDPQVDWPKKISLSQVSRVLEGLLGDVCLEFYTFYNSSASQGAYQLEACQHPWASLFIWALLQNRREMAVYFWEMTDEPVVSALSGCTILRKLSRLKSNGETKRSMRELALEFENRALDVFSKCYQSNESLSFKLLITESPVWRGTTCLQMGWAANARLFFSHDGVQALLSQIWWGDMQRRTKVWKVLLTFFCPSLIYTGLISFRKEELQQHEPGKITETPEDPQQDQQEVARAACFLISRWYQFWGAPVVCFLSNMLMYLLFLILFSYVLLVDLKPAPHGPAVSELVLYVWVFSIACEEIRQLSFMGHQMWRQGLRQYIQDVWNWFDLIAITFFITGVCCRMFAWSYQCGRAFLCIDFMIFALRLIHIGAIHKRMGPKIMMVGKMMKDVLFFLFFLGVWLMAYGVTSQALVYSYDSHPERIFQRTFYKPYLDMFGVETVDGQQSDVPCTKNMTLIDGGAEPCKSPYHNWLVVILQVIYLLVTNMLLINLLIAMFSFTFSKVQVHSDMHWKFQRYNLIVEYHRRPSLAPPFILLSHVNLLIKRFICNVPTITVCPLALELPENESSMLKTWESVQKEDFMTDQNKNQRRTDSERIKRTLVNVDHILDSNRRIKADIAFNIASNHRISGFHDDCKCRLRALESEMEYCSAALGWVVDTLSHKPPRPPPTRSGAFRPNCSGDWGTGN